MIASYRIERIIEVVVAYSCGCGQRAHELGVEEKIMLLLCYGGLNLIARRDHKRYIGRVFYGRFESVVPAERIALQYLVKLSVARTAYLRIRNEEHAVIFFVAGVERICL